MSLDAGDALQDAFRRFYHAAGFDDGMMAAAETRAGRYTKAVSRVPGSFRRITDGMDISIGGRSWRVITGHGHSPEHACLYCGELDVLISGD